MFRQKKQTQALLIAGSVVSKKYTATKKVITERRSKKKYYLYIVVGIVAVLATGWYLLRPVSTGYFSYPLSISPELAASFGEVRKDHFHMGLDLRTNGRENYPVYAVADGFISRIQVSEKGFGKALYVTHLNGITSVYAHLNRFSDEVEKYVHAQQYQQERWAQDLRLPANKFPVAKGEIIARSGNTGTSEGPHLHLELRNTVTGKSINPQTAGFAVSDNMDPVIKNIYWYNKQGSIYDAKATRLAFTTNEDHVVEVSSPRIVLGIETFDKNAQTRFQLGIYKASLYMDDVLMHHFAMDELSENDTRYVNAAIDYKTFVTSKKTIQLLATLPGNNLALFSKAPDDGVLDLHDQKVHRIKIEIKDAAGNSSSIRFAMRFSGTKQSAVSYPKNTMIVTPGRDTTLRQGPIALQIPRNALFDRVPGLITATNTSAKNAASQRIDIYPSTIPVYDSMEITAPSSLSAKDRLRKPVVMLVQTATGRAVIKAVWKKDKITGKLPGFGSVQFVTDTIPPSISLINSLNKNTSSDDGVIQIVCKDNLGGIESFRATIDGHWVVFEKKGDMFTYLPDEYCKTGAHRLSVAATDIAGNIAVEAFVIKR